MFTVNCTIQHNLCFFSVVFWVLVFACIYFTHWALLYFLHLSELTTTTWYLYPWHYSAITHASQQASSHTHCSWLTRSLKQESTCPSNFIFLTLSNWFCVSCFSTIYFCSSAFSVVFFLSDFLELFSRGWL